MVAEDSKQAGRAIGKQGRDGFLFLISEAETDECLEQAGGGESGP